MSQFDLVIIDNKINCKILTPVYSRSDDFGALHEFVTSTLLLVLAGKV